jgi:hypothetical protein
MGMQRLSNIMSPENNETAVIPQDIDVNIEIDRENEERAINSIKKDAI